MTCSVPMSKFILPQMLLAREQPRRMVLLMVYHQELATLRQQQLSKIRAGPGIDGSSMDCLVSGISVGDSIERDVRRVLEGCIRSVEPKRGRGRARGSDDGPVLKVMDRMLYKVTVHPHPHPHIKASGACHLHGHLHPAYAQLNTACCMSHSASRRVKVVESLSMLQNPSSGVSTNFLSQFNCRCGFGELH